MRRKKGGRHRDPNTRPPLQRMLHIHAAIQSGKLPTTVSLGRELEVCSRSVARDIEFMRDRLELPIAYNAERHGYYYSQEVASFPSLTISEGELLALVVAEKAMQQYRGTSFEKPLMTALRKLSDSLPDTVSVNLSQWNESISFRTRAEAVLDLKLFDALAQATARREQLRLTYRKPGQQKGEARVVDPYHLANVNGEWFLFAYDHLRQALRTFVPARITQLERTGEKFERRPGFSIEKELRNSFGVHSGKGEHKVQIHFSPNVADYIREKKWHPSQKIRTFPSGAVELEMTVSSLVEVERWVLQWGGNAKVIAPRELIEHVHNCAQSILLAHPRAVKSRKPKVPLGV